MENLMLLIDCLNCRFSKSKKKTQLNESVFIYKWVMKKKILQSIKNYSKSLLQLLSLLNGTKNPKNVL